MKRLLALMIVVAMMLPCLITGCGSLKKDQAETTTPEETTDGKPEDTDPVETDPTETDPTETDPTETNPTETNPTETAPAETNPTETDPTETDPIETDPTETNPTETNPTETNPTETNPTETDPIETDPIETDPIETDPVETDPIETDPVGPPTPPEQPTELKLTTVKVTTGEDPTEVFAGAELISYLNKKGISASAEGFPIHITIDPSLDEGCFTVEASFEENAGMTIKGGVGRDVVYGVYKFLETYAGFRYFTYDLETQTNDPVVITEGLMMNYVPVIGPRRLTWYGVYHDNYRWCAKNGANFGVGLSEELGGQSLDYGDMFVHTIGKLSGTTYPYPDYTNNPCLTDPEIYATVLANVRKALENNPNINIISISQTDVEMWCQCPNCSKIIEEEGSVSGVWVRFLNKIAEELEDEYPNVTIDTLAYKHTQTAPKITKPHKNVCIRLCSITCCFTHAINDPNCTKNKKFCEDLVAWSKICDNIHIWDYTTNFHYYISTFANLFTIYDNMQFFADNNAVSMFPQGNSQGFSGEFGELRTYLLAKLMCDPYMSREEYSNHMNEFLKAYYGEGWEYIRAFIDKTSELAANGGYKLNGNEVETSAVCGQGIYDHPLTVITRQEYLDNEAYFDELWSQALALAGDRAEYVERSMMQWRLTKLYLHPNAEEAQSLIDDAKAAGVVWKEGNPNVQADSDLSLSPYYWKYGK